MEEVPEKVKWWWNIEKKHLKIVKLYYIRGTFYCVQRFFFPTENQLQSPS